MSTDGTGHGSDGPTAELIGSASDAPSPGERLRASLAHNRATTWARSHHLIVAGGVALVLVVAAGGVYVALRPPPPDPVVALSIVTFNDGAGGGIDSDGRVHVTRQYQVTTTVPGDVVAPVGLVGPGLSEPTSTMPPVHVGLPGLGALGATIDCSGDTWWDATDDDYRVRVVRTDAHDRQTPYDAPLGPAGQGPTYGLATQVRPVCLYSYIWSLAPTVAAPAPATDAHTLDALVNVTNPGTHLLRLSVADYDDGRTVFHQGAVTDVPAGATVPLPFTATATNCSDALPELPLATDLRGQPVSDAALAVQLEDPSIAAAGGQLTSWLRLDPASTRVINAALADLCA